MMATIGNISVSITAQTDKFIKGVNRVVGKLGEMASRAAVMGTAVAGAAAAGVSYLVQQQMQAIDATAKLSDRMGISTEKLGGFQYAANLAGVSSEQLTAGLDRFIKNLPSGSDVGASFEQVAKDIAAIQDPTERARAAVEVFGKAGAELIPLLTSNLAEAQKKADEMGVTFSRIDAAKVEMANDAVSDLWKFVEGVANHIAVYLSPYIIGAAKAMVAWGMKGHNASSIIISGLDFVISNLGKVADFMELVVSGWRLVQAGIANAIKLQIQYVAWLARGADKATFGVFGSVAAFAKELESQADSFGAAGAEYMKQSGDAFDAFMKGRHENQAKKTFDKWKADAEEAAKAIAKEIEEKTKLGTDVSGLERIRKFMEERNKKEQSVKPPATKEIGGFREISQRLLSVSGLSMLAKKMEVHDPKTHLILEKIEKGISGLDRGASVAVYG